MHNKSQKLSSSNHCLNKLASVAGRLLMFLTTQYNGNGKLSMYFLNTGLPPSNTTDYNSSTLYPYPCPSTMMYANKASLYSYNCRTATASASRSCKRPSAMMRTSWLTLGEVPPTAWPGFWSCSEATWRRWEADVSKSTMGWSRMVESFVKVRWRKRAGPLSAPKGCSNLAGM